MDTCKCVAETLCNPPKTITTLVISYAVLCLVSQSCLTLWPHGLHPARLLCPWGFSKQEYWCGLSCPPPGDLPDPGIKPMSLMSLHSQASYLPLAPAGKHIPVVCLVAQSCPTLWNPMDRNPPCCSVHEILQARILEWVALPSSMGFSQTPGIEPQSPIVRVDYLPSEPPGKPCQWWDSLILAFECLLNPCHQGSVHFFWCEHNAT